MRPRCCARRSRNGVAILWALVVLALLAVLLVAVARESVSGRRWLEQRGNQAQALWLARGGVELAADHLLSNPVGYTGESAEVLPGARVRIQVRPEGAAPNTFLVTVEARYPNEERDGVVRALRRRLRRTVENGQARIAVLAVEDEANEVNPPPQ